MLNSSESIKCSVCGRMQTAITDHQSGEVICSSCGTVISEQNLDLANPEWRAFTVEEREDKTRTGSPVSLSRHDMGLATIIGKPNTDASGKKLDTNTLTAFKRLRTWDSRMQINSSHSRNLRKAFSELDILRDKLGLTDQIVERAAYIYRKVEDKGLIRGRTILGMLIAAVYIACRDSGKPRTIKDIASAINIRRKEISRNVRVLTFELDLQVPILNPIQCIAKVANTAMINESTRRLAFGLLRELLSSKILTVGKNPMGLAASILYIASKEMGEDISQEELARAAAVSEPTIRSRIKDIRKSLNICPTS